MTCVVIPWFADRLLVRTSWQAMAWWNHDHPPFTANCIFPEAWRLQHRMAGVPKARDLQLHPLSRVPDPTGHAKPYRRPCRSISGGSPTD